MQIRLRIPRCVEVSFEVWSYQGSGRGSARKPVCVYNERVTLLRHTICLSSLRELNAEKMDNVVRVSNIERQIMSEVGWIDRNANDSHFMFV
jgi:hypothetical protein